MRFDLALLLLASLAVMAASEGGGGGGEQHKSKAKKEETPMTLRPRFLDQYAKGKVRKGKEASIKKHPVFETTQARFKAFFSSLLL